MIFVSDIQREVAAHYGIPADAMRQPRVVGRRSGENGFTVSHPRQVAMALCCRLTEHSQVRIGQLFGGRDHSTVIHAREQVEKRCRNDAALSKLMRRVTLDLTRRQLWPAPRPRSA